MKVAEAPMERPETSMESEKANHNKCSCCYSCITARAEAPPDTFRKHLLPTFLMHQEVCSAIYQQWLVTSSMTFDQHSCYELELPVTFAEDSKTEVHDKVTMWLVCGKLQCKQGSGGEQTCS